MKEKKAGTILINLSNKKIGLVYRKSKKDYTFPKGHLEKGETLQECAIRETEEETGRKNHLISDKEIIVLSYITPLGEDVECYYYIAIDDGKTEKNITEDLKEELVWTDMNETEEKLSYNDLKNVWYMAKTFIDKNLFKRTDYLKN